MAIKKELEIKNKKASFQYFFVDTYTAGVALKGTEVKSIRAGNANLSDAYCFFQAGELYVKSLFIGEYRHGNQFNHESRRTRKLLLRKRELRRLEKSIKEKGFTLVPFRIFLSERNFVKIEIALAKGKKHHDKRDSIKEKDIKRDLNRRDAGRY